MMENIKNKVVKANIPEKIYITPHFERRWFTKEIDDVSVEYTRTDSFIKKIESFLNKKDNKDYYTIGYIKRHLEEIIKEIGL